MHICEYAYVSAQTNASDMSCHIVSKVGKNVSLYLGSAESYVAKQGHLQVPHTNQSSKKHACKRSDHSQIHTPVPLCSRHTESRCPSYWGWGRSTPQSCDIAAYSISIITADYHGKETMSYIFVECSRRSTMNLMKYKTSQYVLARVKFRRGEWKKQIIFEIANVISGQRYFMPMLETCSKIFIASRVSTILVT